ncbi:MAG: ribonuclease HII [Candidatus Nealsonbacteria bacterium]|nr:ribonuclease HII [Candidatus Nealsonbacteria bacterium]
MKCPNLNEERKLWKKGYKCVVGIDEVGRGPLAGPVLAVALVVKNPGLKILNCGIKDSKKLSSRKREEIYKAVASHPQIIYGIGKVSHKVIDKINILNATKLAMKRAVGNLKFKKIDFLILDGNFGLDGVDIMQRSIVKGDEKVMSCALASIIAKVERDRLMVKYHKKYPDYGFDRHKGYGTRFHYEMLRNFGPSVIHRKSFNLYG